MGYTADEIQGLGAEFLPRICHPEDLPKLQTYFQAFEAMKDGDVAQIEYRMKHKDGKWRWMLSNDTVFDRGPSGSVVRMLGAATDITARKSAEDMIAAEKNAADDANEELRAFAYSMSHDMKAPSNTLDLLLSELRERHASDLKPEARELVDLSRDVVRKMQHLIEDVLDYTRVIGTEMDFEEVPLSPLVADVELRLAADLREADATLTVGTLPVVSGSPLQLSGYLQNIIGNALKYREPSRPLEIRIEAVSEADDPRIRLTVTDNGIGISKADQERIFGMFKRLHLDDEVPGTGLGLALCKRVAVNHGGDIVVRSAVGQGSTFEIDLERA